jgi:S-layer protein (TIGR01567 family)
MLNPTPTPPDTKTPTPMSTNIGTPIAIITTSTPAPTIPQTSSIILKFSSKQLDVVDDKFKNSITMATDAGLVTGKTLENGNYYFIDFQGNKYVALNGKIDKLAKLSYEMGKIPQTDGTFSYDKLSMTTGETWSIGDGWELTVIAADAGITPRQVWFTIKKDGILISEANPNNGDIYTYSTNINSETNIPVFVIFIDSIFSGATSDMVQFKYAWAISPSVINIKQGERFEDYDIVTVDNVKRQLELRSPTERSIPNPIRTATSISTPKSLAQNMRWFIGDNWELTAMSIDVNKPKQVWLKLYSRKYEKYVDDIVLREGDTYNYTDNFNPNNTFSTRVESIYAGPDGNMVVLTDTVYQ